MNKRLTIKAAIFCCSDLPRLAAFGLQGDEVDAKLLPAAIRRRTALTTKMAITAGIKACNLAAVDRSGLRSVFASVGGEIQVTDALCKALPNSQAMLSPTQFHNSVHNTTAGYWSIINQNRAPSTAIAAGDDTLAMALIESWAQLQQMPGDLLLVCYDELWPQYLEPPLGEIAFACALVVSNTDTADHRFSISIPEIDAAPSPLPEDLRRFIQSAPAAAAVPLLQALHRVRNMSRIPLNLGGVRWVTHAYIG